MCDEDWSLSQGIFPDDQRIYKRLSDAVIVHITPEQISIYVRYFLWRTIGPLDERGLAIACAELARRKLVPIIQLSQCFRISRPTIYKWMEKLEATYVPSDHRPDPRELGDLGISNRMLRFIRERPDVPAEQMVELIWKQFHRPIDVFGIERLRAFIAERQLRRKSSEPKESNQDGLFRADVSADGAELDAEDESSEQSSGTPEETAEAEELDEKDAADAVADANEVAQPSWRPVPTS